VTSVEDSPLLQCRDFVLGHAQDLAKNVVAVSSEQWSRAVESALGAPHLPVYSGNKLIIAGVRVRCRAGTLSAPSCRVRSCSEVIDDSPAKRVPLVLRPSCLFSTGLVEFSQPRSCRRFVAMREASDPTFLVRYHPVRLTTRSFWRARSGGRH